jgi:hypothetical protein
VAALNKITDTVERKRLGALHAKVRDGSKCGVAAGADNETVEQRTAAKATLVASLDSLQKDFEERHWNAGKIEVAAALSGVSRDSTGRDPVAERQEVWVGFMQPFGPLDNDRTWLSNVGLGATGVFSRSRDSLTHRLESGFVGAARLVGGGNALRAFGEGQYSTVGTNKGFLANAGAELRIIEGTWLQFSAGYTNRDASATPGTTSPRHWVTGFHIQGAPNIGGFFGLK